MKKILLSIVAFTLCIISVYGEQVVGNYTLGYFNKTYEIEAGKPKNGKFAIYIQVSAERDYTRAMVGISSDDLEDLKQSLIQMKEKYEEWTKVAKENNVTEMTKSMDIKFPSATICWNASKWFFSFGCKLQPQFLILKGKHVVSIVKKVTASSNDYIDETIYWVFSDPKEIDALISQLDFETIKSKLETIENDSELFK